MHVHIRQTPNSWETITVPREEDAMRIIKERYPNAVTGPWETDWDGLLPAGESMFVYEDGKSGCSQIPTDSADQESLLNAF